MTGPSEGNLRGSVTTAPYERLECLALAREPSATVAPAASGKIWLAVTARCREPSARQVADLEGEQEAHGRTSPIPFAGNGKWSRATSTLEKSLEVVVALADCTLRCVRMIHPVTARATDTRIEGVVERKPETA